MKRITWIVLGWLVVIMSVQAASFECGRASTKIEKLICSDDELSKLDEKLNTAYKTAIQDPKEAESIRQAQKQWMKERNGCADTACIKHIYENRLVSLHSMISSANANFSDYVLAPLPDAYPDRSEFEGELSEPAKDPTACGIYLQNLRYFARHNLPLSCGQPVAPALTDKIKPVEWENLDPEKHPELFKALVTKVFSTGHSEVKDFPSEAALSLERERVRKGGMVFRRAKLELKGEIALPPLHKPVQRVFQIVQFGFNVTDPSNPEPRFRCEQNTGRIMSSNNQWQLQFFITSENLRELYGDMSDLQLGSNSSYSNLLLINELVYGEMYDEKGTVMLSEVRSDSFARSCLFQYTHSE